MKYLFLVFILTSIFFGAACELSNNPPKSSTENEKDIYLEKGKKIASSTFTTLSGNLQQAIQKGGISNAVKYCNLAAFPLVDSLSQLHEAVIRRTSLKTRNPKNKPTPGELKQLKIYQQQVISKEELKPYLKELPENKMAFYAPIQMMPLCGKCHGKIGDSLLEKDYQLIQKLYPQDKAINYKSGDLRGMWSISFNK